MDYTKTMVAILDPLILIFHCKCRSNSSRSAISQHYYFEYACQHDLPPKAGCLNGLVGAGHPIDARVASPLEPWG